MHTNTRSRLNPCSPIENGSASFKPISAVLSMIFVVKAAVIALLLQGCGGGSTEIMSSGDDNGIQPIAPSITRDLPESAEFSVGDLAHLRVSAIGVPQPSYQWQRQDPEQEQWRDLNSDDDRYAHVDTPTLSWMVELSDQGARYRCLIINERGEVTSRAITLQVHQGDGPTVPSVTSQPVDASVSDGEAVSFSLTASGSTPLVYQWQRFGAEDWEDIPGATANSYSFTATLAHNNASLRCLVTNHVGQVSSSIVSLTVTAVAPEIIIDPADVSVGEGSDASFSVTASGSEPLSYQWQVSGDSGDTWDDITDADAATLTVESVSQADSGNLYRCLVSNVVDEVISAAATLTVTLDPVAPIITEGPIALEVDDGEEASFSVTAEGSTPRVYQWQRFVDGDWENISGATSSTYAFTASLADDAAQFRCLVENHVGSTTSESATLTVTAVAPEITADPADVSVTEGSDASFSVTASGSEPLSYQWQVWDGGDWIDIVDADAATLTLEAISLDDNGNQYRCLVSNVAGEVISAAATLTITEDGTPPSITGQPEDQTVDDGETASLSLIASGATPMIYQWQRWHEGEWVDIPGATGSTYLRQASAADDGLRLRCVVTNLYGSVTSDEVDLSVTSITTNIDNHPQDISTLTGGSVTFQISASGSQPLQYQWQRSDDGGATWDDIVGAASANYSLTAQLSDHQAQFRCLVTGPGGDATSQAALLQVSESAEAPQIVTHPESSTGLVGEEMSVGVAASGTGPLNYQWQQSSDGSTWTPISGATAATYSRTVSEGDDGLYFRCQVTNAVGMVFSGSARWTVVGLAPQIVEDPQDQTVSLGGDTTFTVVVTGAEPLTYVWQRSDDGGSTWNEVPNGDGASLTLSNLTLADSGARVRVQISNEHGSATSAAAEITVTADAWQWTGNAGDQRWSSAGNWQVGSVPPAGVQVSIADAAVILPAGGTQPLAQISLSQAQLAGGPLRLAANGQLSISGAVSISSPLAASDHSITIHLAEADAQATLSANLDFAQLDKTGPGRLRLTSQEITTDGSITVSAGSLQMDGHLQGGGAVSVAAGARLSGSGQIDGPVTIADEGTLAPGSEEGE